MAQIGRSQRMTIRSRVSAAAEPRDLDDRGVTAVHLIQAAAAIWSHIQRIMAPLAPSDAIHG